MGYRDRQMSLKKSRPKAIYLCLRLFGMVWGLWFGLAFLFGTYAVFSREGLWIGLGFVLFTATILMLSLEAIRARRVGVIFCCLWTCILIAGTITMYFREPNTKGVSVLSFLAPAMVVVGLIGSVQGVKGFRSMKWI